MDTPSAYVQRCQEAYAEYLRLVRLGVGHAAAVDQSGFMAAVTGTPNREIRDGKLAQQPRETE